MTKDARNAYIERLVQLDASETKETLTPRQINTRARTWLMVHNTNCAPTERIFGKQSEQFVNQYRIRFIKVWEAQQ